MSDSAKDSPGGGQLESAMTDRLLRERLLRDAVAAGDDSAWRTWFELEYAPLEAYVLWRCGSLRDFADDVLQESWMTAVRRIRSFNPDAASFHSWLCGIAANVLRNQMRSFRRRTARQESLSGDVGRDDPAIAQRERSERLTQALAALPERYEAVLRMKYLDGRSVAEIACEQRESEKAIESLLTRARAAFREAYGDE
jgi:RNA polymerase sigma-70 factor, ECF subfamily